MAEFSYVIKSKFADCLSALEAVSYDKENQEYMCHSQKQVVDFDKLTFMLYPTKQPSSYDALMIEEDIKDIFCIEFKNQKISAIGNSDLQKKVVDSDTTIKKLCYENSIQKRDYRYVLCVVSKFEQGKYRYRRFKEKIAHYGLEAYRGKYFDDVVTNDIVFFKNEFNKKFGCNK